MHPVHHFLSKNDVVHCRSSGKKLFWWEPIIFCMIGRMRLTITLEIIFRDKLCREIGLKLPVFSGLSFSGMRVMKAARRPSGTRPEVMAELTSLVMELPTAS